MKQFSNKQRVCKNKTKRHNKRNKTRKGGAPTNRSNTKPKNFTAPRIPSSLGKSVTKKNTQYGPITVTTDRGKNPDQGIEKGDPKRQRVFDIKAKIEEERKRKKKEEEQSLSGRIASLYNGVSNVFTGNKPTGKPKGKPKEISLLEEVLRSTSGKAAAAMKAERGVVNK